MRIAKLELRAPSGVGIIGLPGPEGPKGADGKSGRQGETGPQGERGAAGPKGEGGSNPSQNADFEKRIAALEKRSARTGAGSQVASADPRETVLPPQNNFLKHSSGCFFAPPNFQPFTMVIKVGDRFCDVNGEANSTVTKINDSFVEFNNSNCGLKGTCNTAFSRRVAMTLAKIDMSPNGTMLATVDWRPQ